MTSTIQENSISEASAFEHSIGSVQLPLSMMDEYTKLHPSEDLDSSSYQSFEVRVPVVKNEFETQTSILLQKYTGFVTEVCGETFITELMNHEDESKRIQVEFEKEELGSEKEYLDVGMPIIWTFSRSIVNGGSATVEHLYFRRKKRVTDNRLKKARSQFLDLLQNQSSDD